MGDYDASRGRYSLGLRDLLAVTSKRYLRIYSLGGAQRQIISLEGAPVSITGKDDCLAVVWHEAARLVRHQVTKCSLMLCTTCDTQRNSLVVEWRSLSVNSDLSWFLRRWYVVDK